MSVVEPEPAGGRLLARALAMVLRPSQTWDRIATETTPPSDLFRGYVAPLAAIPAVCGLLGMMLFGYSIAGIGFQQSLPAAVIEAAVDFTLTLAAVFLMAIAIDLLARPFGGARDAGQALKLAAYSGTAMWLAGIFSLYPSFGLVIGALAALYSLYTLYLGLPKLMRAPPESALTYFASVLVALIAIVILKGVLVAKASELGGPLRAVGLS
ncbi:Yip1 family protein [Phenylobacterium sp. J367]|uniref:Yip1 family protein n=1 Tax=Phenylobacterium sp. J367 TaxID=2898435 RepID=UPI0021518F7E|nr:Yip1 family protein [Phenylobacterium sp. J367]MCR5880284.1 YIP1 family protein [Phenylobacterium sp. J367]